MLCYSVVITSANRPEILHDTVASLARQSHPPDRIILILNTPSDLSKELDPADSKDERLIVRYHQSGNSAKRNLGATLTYPSSEILLFLDDDVELHPEYARYLCCYFSDHEETVAVTGRVIEDRWMKREEAVEILANTPIPQESFRSHGKHWVLHGCNMAIRRGSFLRNQFDENLPLYSWGEDYEISIRLAREGLVGRLSTPLCIHLKAPAGRLDRRHLVWAMIANNYYFLQKGSIHTSRRRGYLRFFYCTLRLIAQNLILDLKTQKSLFSGTRGGLLALRDLISGRLHPLRLKEIVKT